MSTRAPAVMKQIFFWFFVVIMLVVIVNLSRGAVELLNARKRMDKAESEVSELQQKQEDLTEELEWKTSDAFVEQEIRNELRMARPDDVVIMVDESLYENMGSVEEEFKGEKILPNYIKWLNLFL